MSIDIMVKDSRFDPEARSLIITAEGGTVFTFRLGPMSAFNAVSIRRARNVALDEAAAIARANTTAPRIWRGGRWIAPAAEEIAESIEALKVAP